MGSIDGANDPLAKTTSRLQGTTEAYNGLLLRMIREPLLHFVAAGFVLFLVYALLHPDRFEADTSHRIELSAADVGRIELGFIARWQRKPTPAELQGLIAGEVRNEILSREATALGLDKGDAIIKRRLAQKMDFLADDLSRLRDPTPAELRAWFDMHRGEFAPAPRVTFRHVYFSTDQRGSSAEGAARKALALTTDRRNAVPRGDPFMFQDYYAGQTEVQVAQVFGSDFAKTLFSSATQRWSGPFASGLGWHLVWADELKPGELPSYDEVESDVRERWMFEQRETAKSTSFKAMLARYEVVLPSQSAVDLAMAPRTASAK